MPDKLADGGGHSPQTLTGSLCFQDRPGAVVQFTIHKNGYPGENRTRGLFLRREALLVLLSYGIIESGGGGGNRTHSLNLARIGRPYDCHPQMLPAGVAPASSALEASRSLLLSYGSAKWSLAPVSHRASVVLQTTAFACSLARQWCGALVTLQAGADARLFYRQPRLFTELSPRKWLQG
jgi:hypothetical protein